MRAAERLEIPGSKAAIASSAAALRSSTTHRHDFHSCGTQVVTATNRRGLYGKAIALAFNQYDSGCVSHLRRRG